MDFLSFNFYGAKVQISSSYPDILSRLKKDFSYFLSQDNSPDVTLKIYNRQAEYALLPSLKAKTYLPEAILYEGENIRYIDYLGKALSIYHYRQELVEIYSEDSSLLHEISYLTVLSRVGEFLDRKGLHRIHALAFSYRAVNILCLLPAGGGKTTLGLALLKEAEARLFSDDTPLISRQAEIFPFPLRIGVCPGEVTSVPERFLSEFKRRKYGTKHLIDIEYLKDKIARVGKVNILLIGERIFSEQATLKPIPKIKAFGPVFKNGVIGFGLPQLIEYFLTHGIGDCFKKIFILFSRMITMGKLVVLSKNYQFQVGRDRKKNIDTLIKFLKSHKDG